MISILYYKELMIIFRAIDIVINGHYVYGPEKMSDVIKLIEEVVLPHCEAELSIETQRQHKAWVDNGFADRGKMCIDRAKYKIDDKHLCKKHAGLYLLDNFERVHLSGE